jgi:hypothetical protein
MLEEQIASMNMTIEFLQKAKPGFSLLSKKKGKAVRIMNAPQELNLKIKQ